MNSKRLQQRGAAIAQWVWLHLPSCCPEFESQAHHLCFYQAKFDLWHVEKTKINRKRCRELSFTAEIQKGLHFDIRTIRWIALNVNLFGAILSSVSKLGHKSEICRIWQNVWSLVRTLVLVYWLAIEYHHLSLNLSQVFFVKLFIEIWPPNNCGNFEIPAPTVVFVMRSTGLMTIQEHIGR